MFKRLAADFPPELVPFTFDGRELEACAGDSIAAALFAAGHAVTRQSLVSEAPRGPYCLMGACFECLVEVDGISNRQACMVLVTSGMVVRRQAGATELRDE